MPSASRRSATSSLVAAVNLAAMPLTVLLPVLQDVLTADRTRWAC